MSTPEITTSSPTTALESAALLASIRVDEPSPTPAGRRSVGQELAEGARWVYGHRTLAPYAIGLHTWFFFNSAAMTVLVFYAATDLGLGAVSIGLALAAAGVSGVLGAGLAPRLGERLGLGVVACAASWLAPLAFALVALAPSGPAGLAVLVASQLVYGVANGLGDPLTMSYRNAVTPDRLRARMNATIRSINWGTIVVSAPLAGWFATTWGNRPTIWGAVVGLVVAAAIQTFSPFRSAQMPTGD